MPKFIFLELIDSEIHALLNGLKAEFGGKPTDANIHLTVRGPYNRNVPSKNIERFEQIIQEEPVLIHGAGIFDQVDEYVVYLKVENKNLRRIWWKPDYPIKKYRFNPHISIYRGSDRKLAYCIYDFLRKENIKLLCHKFKLTSYVSKQVNFLPDDWEPNGRHFLQLVNRGLVKADILQRAHNIVRECNV